MDAEKKQMLISILSLIEDKPYMFIAEGMPAIVNFLLGFDLVLKMLDFYTLNMNEYSRVLSERGWGDNTVEAINKMMDKGLTQDLITKEFVSIRLEIVNK